MVGRDVGTEVFPNARLKLYLTASNEIRATRRHLELLLSQGIDIGYGEVLVKMRTRDEHDRNREVSPMRIPPDAIYVDTSHMDIETAQRRLFEISCEKLRMKEGNIRVC